MMRRVELRLPQGIYLLCPEVTSGVFDVRLYIPKVNRDVSADVCTCVEVKLKDGSICYMTKKECATSTEVLYVIVDKKSKILVDSN